MTLANAVREATRLLRRVGRASGLAALLVTNQACGLEVEAAYPSGAYDDYPPDAYIAATEPVYFEGHAAYWYGNRWYYRDGGRWGHYDREPAFLYQRRLQGVPRQRVYEPNRGGRGRPAGRAGPSHHR